MNQPMTPKDRELRLLRICWFNRWKPHTVMTAGMPSYRYTIRQCVKRIRGMKE